MHILPGRLSPGQGTAGEAREAQGGHQGAAGPQARSRAQDRWSRCPSLPGIVSASALGVPCPRKPHQDQKQGEAKPDSGVPEGHWEAQKSNSRRIIWAESPAVRTRSDEINWAQKDVRLSSFKRIKRCPI